MHFVYFCIPSKSITGKVVPLGPPSHFSSPLSRKVCLRLYGRLRGTNTRDTQDRCSLQSVDVTTTSNFQYLYTPRWLGSTPGSVSLPLRETNTEYSRKTLSQVSIWETPEGEGLDCYAIYDPSESQKERGWVGPVLLWKLRTVPRCNRRSRVRSRTGHRDERRVVTLGFVETPGVPRPCYG